MVAIFDFDGVINKSEYFSIKYAKEFAISHQLISQFFQLEFDKCAKGEADIKSLLPPYLEKWNWDEDVDSFLNFWFQNDIELDMELINFIAEIKKQNHYVVLASQQEVNRKNHLWEELELNLIFHKFYCTCDLGYLKSDKEFYSIILADLKAHHIIKSAREVIFFDDSKRFIETASEIGIKTYQVDKDVDIIEICKNWLQQ